MNILFFQESVTKVAEQAPLDITGLVFSQAGVVGLLLLSAIGWLLLVNKKLNETNKQLQTDLNNAKDNSKNEIISILEEHKKDVVEINSSYQKKIEEKDSIYMQKLEEKEAEYNKSKDSTMEELLKIGHKYNSICEAFTNILEKSNAILIANQSVIKDCQEIIKEHIKTSQETTISITKSLDRNTDSNKVLAKEFGIMRNSFKS